MDTVKIAERVVRASMRRRQAAKWQSLPEGWTEASLDKFWGSLVGEVKNKVTKCIKQMKGKVGDPGAFCASLADKVEGKGWRSASSRIAAVIDIRTKPQPSGAGPVADFMAAVKADGKEVYIEQWYRMGSKLVKFSGGAHGAGFGMKVLTPIKSVGNPNTYSADAVSATGKRRNEGYVTVDPSRL